MIPPHRKNEENEYNIPGHDEWLWTSGGFRIVLTHDNQLHFLAADSRSLLNFTLVGARVCRLQSGQVDGGVAALRVGCVEVDSTLHGLVIILVHPITRVQNHLDAEKKNLQLMAVSFVFWVMLSLIIYFTLNLEFLIAFSELF